LLKAGDPVANALFAQDKQIQMPNLQLTDQQIEEVLRYLDNVSPAKSR
jgi:hypothetical protein